jgi:hypothetical protein
MIPKTTIYTKKFNLLKTKLGMHMPRIMAKSELEEEE